MGIVDDVEAKNARTDMCGELRTLFLFLSSFSLIVFDFRRNSNDTWPVYGLMQYILRRALVSLVP